jgi:aminomethyltransferase
MIINGACKHKDWAYFQKVADEEFSSSISSGKLKLEFNTAIGLLALQGPRAAEVLKNALGPGDSLDLTRMGFLNATNHYIKPIEAECMVSRCGYTGEDGFEISVPEGKAMALADLLLSQKCGGSAPVTKMAGLGCRDTLRLECGMCLYGHELNESISPVEAQLTWLIGKRRKQEGGFYGYEKIKRELAEGVPMRRCGFMTQGMAAREQTEIITESGDPAGKVSSGSYSPTLKKPIGMAYVKVPLNKVGTKLQAVVKGKPQPIVIHKLPFVQTKYYRAPA